MSDSPAAVLVDGVGGLELAVADGVGIPAGTRALLITGRDGATARFVAVDAAGRLLATTSEAPPANSSVAAVAQNIATVELLAANANRKGAIIFNNAEAALLYVKLGSGATTTDFSVVLLPRGAFGLPFPVFTGQITGVWSVAGPGSAQVTETLP